MKEHILIVDDNRDAADALARIISSHGYETKAVYSGEEAIRATASFLPNMAMIDIGMPELDGYETVKRIRAERDTDHIILVAVTAWSRDEDKRRAYDYGFDHHVAKPMSTETLEEILALFQAAARGAL
jgi:two-component system, chemotaxis family, CheB/CheR fusion protein